MVDEVFQYRKSSYTRPGSKLIHKFVNLLVDPSSSIRPEVIHENKQNLKMHAHFVFIIDVLTIIMIIRILWFAGLLF